MAHQFERCLFVEATTNVAGPFCLTGFSIVQGEPGSVQLYKGDVVAKANMVDFQNSADVTVVNYTEGVRIDNGSNLHVVPDACNVVIRYA